MSTVVTPSLRAKLGILLLPLLLVVTAFGCRPQEAENANTNSATTNTTVRTNTRSNATVNLATNGSTLVTARSTTESELQRLASSFAERYGSYSNQTNFENLDSLLVFMTTSFAGSTRDFVKAERAKDRDTSIYYGITTQATSIQTRSFQDAAGTASFLVTTYKKEIIGSSGNSKTFREDGLIDMKREGGAWKVQSVIWQGRY